MDGRADDRDHVGRTLKTLEQCALHWRSLRLTCRRCRSVRVLDAIPLRWLSGDRHCFVLPREATGRRATGH